MILIIGGAFQGKGAYAKKRYPQISFQEGGDLSREELFLAQGILNLQDYIKREIKKGGQVSGLGRELFAKNPGVVVTCQEVGCGIVPVDRWDRAWREATGRVCTEIAENSSQVVRMCCGIGTVIKDA